MNYSLKNMCTQITRSLVLFLCIGVFAVPSITNGGGGGSSHTYTGFPAVPSPPTDPNNIYSSLFAAVTNGFSTLTSRQPVLKDNYCQVSHGVQGRFVPSKKAAGWLSFLTNAPADVTIENCIEIETCIADTIIASNEIHLTANATVAPPTICYLDINRKIACTNGAAMNVNLSTNSAGPDLGLGPMPGFEDVEYIDYEPLGNFYSGYSNEVPFGGGCGIKADDLEISCSDSIYPSYNDGLLPTTEHFRRIVQNHPYGQFTELAMGKSSACALGVDKTVSCWGGMMNPEPNFFVISGSVDWVYEGEIPEPTGEFKKIKNVSWNMFCGLKQSNSAIECWGVNREGNSTKFYPASNQNFVDMFFLGGVHYGSAICGVTAAGYIQCPSNADLTTVGLDAASMAIVDGLENEGPFSANTVVEDSIMLVEGKRFLLLHDDGTMSARGLRIWKNNNNNTVLQNATASTSIPTLAWDNNDFFGQSMPAPGGDAAEHTCGFVGGSLQCIQTGTNVAGQGTVTTIPAVHQFYADSFCSTID